METKAAATPITIAIVEDDQKTRKGLAELLSAETRVRCVAMYPTGEAAVQEIPRVNPHVALVDINLPGMNGIECVSRLKEQLPQLQLLMLTKYEERDLIFNSLRAGASGYLLKKMLTAELVSAIEQVHAGGSPMSTQIARKVVEYFNRLKSPATNFQKLSPREHEVLALLAQGFLYKEISDRLGVSFHTVRFYQRAIYEKLHIHSRTEATVKYLAQD